MIKIIKKIFLIKSPKNNRAGFTQFEKFMKNVLLFKVSAVGKKSLYLRKQNLNTSQTGFTLLEAIIYLAIVGVVISSVVDFAVTMGSTTAKMNANIEASRNRRFALTTINYLIRNADGLLKDVNGECSNFSVNPPVLALYFDNDNYLPGYCVERGGGVKITVVNNRLKMTCYPNINNNGQYNACTAPAGNEYFLTGPEVIVNNNNLDFSTSTASTTANSYTSVSTYLKVTMPSADQISLRASSEATSTANMRNEQPNGLISWYKFDETDTSSAVDSVSGYTLTCSATGVSGLVDGSARAFYFDPTETDLCYANNPEKLNFGTSFSLSLWLETDGLDASEHTIINKHNGASKGYYLFNNEDMGQVIFTLCNGTSCSYLLSTDSYLINDGTVYNITVVYDKPSDSAKMLIYEKGVGNISTTTANNLPFLVNDSTADYPRIGDNFAGTIDEFRLYNRALSDSEIWALQSQGAN